MGHLPRREPPHPTHQPSPCAGCVRIVNLLGEPTATLAPVLTFDFPIETVGKWPDRSGGWAYPRPVGSSGWQQDKESGP